MNYVGVVIFVLACFGVTAYAEVTQGGCSCAIFSGPQSFEPLIEHTLPLNVSCDEEGSEKCIQLCIVLAQAVKERAPALICEKLNWHVENLKVFLQARACNAENWSFTGLEGSEAICCHMGKETPCPVLSGE